MFLAKLVNEERPNGEPMIRVMVTHNGRQWQSIRVTKEELVEVKRHIDIYLRENEDA